MNIKQIALVMLIPLSTLAELEVVSRPLSPFIQAGTNNTILFYITNYGDATELVPAGKMDDDGQVIPTWIKTIGWEAYKFDQNKPQFIGGLSTSKYRGPIFWSGREVVNGATNRIGGVVDYNPSQELPPGQSITYKVEFDLSELTRGLTNDDFDMCIITVKLGEFDMTIPTVSLFSDNKKSNQRIEPTANTPVNPVNEQGADTAHP